MVRCGCMQSYAPAIQTLKAIYETYLKPYAKEAPQNEKFRVVDIYTEIIAIEAAIQDTQTAADRAAHLNAIELSTKNLIQAIAALSVLTPHYGAIKAEISKNLT